MVATRLRLTIMNSRGLQLVGHLFPAESDSIVIMAHGFTSDKYSRGRFEQIADALNQAGLAAFAFDFSGCGESDDDSITLAKEASDLSSVISFLKAEGYAQLGLYGHSLGGLVCLSSYAHDIRTMVLTGPLTGPTASYNWSTCFSPVQLEELKKRGEARYAVDSFWRRSVTIDRQLLSDLTEIDQERLLSAVKCPVLIIHGNSMSDEEELSLLKTTQEGIRYLPDGSRLEIIEGARHNFLENMYEVSSMAAAWFTQHMTNT